MFFAKKINNLMTAIANKVTGSIVLTCYFFVITKNDKTKKADWKPTMFIERKWGSIENKE